MYLPSRVFLNRFPSALTCLILAIGVWGCTPSEPKVVMAGDSKGISDLIDEWNDAKSSPKTATSFFVSGKMPPTKDFKKYGRYSYALMETPSVSGDTATLPISIYDEVEGKDAGKFDWTFKKEGEGWKIESAPLP